MSLIQFIWEVMNLVLLPSSWQDLGLKQQWLEDSFLGEGRGGGGSESSLGILSRC